MSEIEEEIRRRMWEERQRAGAQSSGPYGAAQPGGAGGPQPGSNGTGQGGPHAWTHGGQQRSSGYRSKLEEKRSQGGLWGLLATIGLLLLKFGGPLVSVLAKFKSLVFLKGIFVTGASMLVSIWLEAMLFGWGFAAGIVILIFIHECGHAIAAKALGHPVNAMVFIPFMGAYVTTGRGRGSRNVVEDAHIGIMGPVFGTMGGIGCLVLYQMTGSLFWAALAHFNFFINLFNLTPTPPLDGGWITPLFSPKLMALGLVLLFVVAPHNPMIWVLAFMSIPRILHGWRAKSTDPYYQAPASAKWKYGLAYLGLAAFLAYANIVLDEEIGMRRGRVSRVAMQVTPDTRS